VTLMVYIYDFVRTGRGKATTTGGLHAVGTIDLVTTLLTALQERGTFHPDLVDDVVLGVASQVGEQGANLARTAALAAGWSAPGVTINRFCASGIDAVAHAAARIGVGEISCAIAGGVESVSRVPIFSDEGLLWADQKVRDEVGSVHMGVAADLNAHIDHWHREELDQYAVETHTKAARAWQSGHFDDEVVAVTTPAGVFATDELVRPGMSMEIAATLPPVFGAIGAAGDDAIVHARYPHVEPLQHVHTVATSPAMADGASLLLLGDAAFGERVGMRPRARIIASSVRSVDPVLMLTAGQGATEAVIDRGGLRANDIDVFEFAEAFAALCLRFRRDLGAAEDRLNPSGGTIAMGHAFGATGATMVGGALRELERLDARYAVGAVSGAAGLGVAVLLERCD
jgi:acetyl-CoA C-acetyltransferase